MPRLFAALRTVARRRITGCFFSGESDSAAQAGSAQHQPTLAGVEALPSRMP
ncbi:hypothetical protein Z948_1357 [Sulfitobacter donghicola DSW-25 = KCTC 12864 = JCM 14565]|nr:hypothetical protein Z948_1357 [Sulfitobacter donghicola DSW-25 = KCTC 12864 = JCM 14565]